MEVKLGEDPRKEEASAMWYEASVRLGLATTRRRRAGGVEDR